MNQPPSPEPTKKPIWLTILTIVLIILAVIGLIIVLVIGFVLYSCSRH